jgi:NO-binding membrane sensor protein with MHYT domain
MGVLALMVVVHNFSYGLLTPVLGYVMSCLGCFLGLRCTTRARALQGASRVRWLLLAAVSIGAAGVWGMHFVAMLGFSIPGQSIGYSVLVTIASMLIAAVVVSIGLLIVGFGGDGQGPLITGGLIIGLGVASMHYIGMSAMRMPDIMRYNTGVVVLSVIIAVVAGTAALWAALRLHTVWSTLVASLIMGVAISGMHYTGMAAMHVYAAAATSNMAGMHGGASATSFLLPLILGISVLTFVLTAVISLSPTAAEIREDAELMARIARNHSGYPGHDSSRRLIARLPSTAACASERRDSPCAGAVLRGLRIRPRAGRHCCARRPRPALHHLGCTRVMVDGRGIRRGWTGDAVRRPVG